LIGSFHTSISQVTAQPDLLEWLPKRTTEIATAIPIRLPRDSDKAFFTTPYFLDACVPDSREIERAESSR
jgi:hypothetical protein